MTSTNPATYNDLYLRDTFDDAGVVPSIGVPSASPDIIPYQSSTLTWQHASDTYSGPDIGTSIVQQAVNNIYIRSKNIGTVADSGAVTAYYVKASLICAPNIASNAWQALQNPAGTSSIPLVNSSSSTSIAAQGIAVSQSAFLLTGLPPVANDHYCLIAVINTPSHSVTVPTTFATNGDFVSWVHNNPAVAWRNISYIANQSVEQVALGQQKFLFQDRSPGLSGVDRCHGAMHGYPLPGQLADHVAFCAGRWPADRHITRAEHTRPFLRRVDHLVNGTDGDVVHERCHALLFLP
jgi:hypothetical protein